MKFYVKTDRGKTRRINQDSCYACSLDDNSVFAVVCDGMGGTNGGEIASGIAVQVLSQRFLGGWRNGITAQSVRNLFQTSVSAANISILDEADNNKELAGMGSTVVAAAVFGQTAMVAHAGDSRAYLLNGSIRRITKDHSLVQSLVDKGEITPEEAENHPKKNYITRALGVSDRLEAELNEIEIKSGDHLLLCSDGLTNYVPEADILETVKQNQPDKAVELLIAKANRNGGGDNISVILVCI